MADIDFFTFIVKSSPPFAEFLRQTGEMTKSGEHNIHWKCVLSDGFKETPKGFECIAKHEKTSPCPSARHAHAIHEAIQKATNDYIIISDADIAITYKNWDKKIIRILDEGHSCFGSPNSSNEHGEQDFPNVPFFVFKKEILQKVNLDFRPILDKRNIIIRVKAEKEKMMGRGIGDLVFFETGCKLSSEFERAGLKSKCLCMEAIHQDSKKIQLPPMTLKQKINYINIKRNYKRIHHNRLIEYHHNGKLFLTHLGNSHSIYIMPQQIWKEKIENYLKEVLFL